jgi:hypothetical protein
VAQVTAAGGLPITVGISMISGGAGTAVSSASTASKLAASKVSAEVYSHTARELLGIVANKLKGLGVDPAATKLFIANSFYSPADEYQIAEALEGLGATNTAVFVENAGTAGSFDVAKFNRYRAELLARESVRLGTLKSFVLLSGFVLNRDASGRLVAAFPFDTLSWTDTVSRSFARLGAGIAALHEIRLPLLASVGPISPSAQVGLKTLGWETENLD